MRIDDYIEHSDSSGGQTIGNGRGMYSQQPEPSPVVYESVKQTRFQKWWNEIKSWFRKSPPVKTESAWDIAKPEVVVTDIKPKKTTTPTGKLNTAAKIAISLAAVGGILAAGYVVYNMHKKNKRK